MPWLVTVSAARASGARTRKAGMRRGESRMVRRFMMLLAPGMAISPVSLAENRAILRPRQAARQPIPSAGQDGHRRFVDAAVAGGKDAAVGGEAERLALPVG